MCVYGELLSTSSSKPLFVFACLSLAAILGALLEPWWDTSLHSPQRLYTVSCHRISTHSKQPEWDFVSFCLVSSPRLSLYILICLSADSSCNEKHHIFPASIHSTHTEGFKAGLTNAPQGPERSTILNEQQHQLCWVCGECKVLDGGNGGPMCHSSFQQKSPFNVCRLFPRFCICSVLCLCACISEGTFCSLKLRDGD